MGLGKTGFIFSSFSAIVILGKMQRTEHILLLCVPFMGTIWESKIFSIKTHCRKPFQIYKDCMWHYIILIRMDFLKPKCYTYTLYECWDDLFLLIGTFGSDIIWMGWHFIREGDPILKSYDLYSALFNLSMCNKQSLRISLFAQNQLCELLTHAKQNSDTCHFGSLSDTFSSVHFFIPLLSGS